MLLSPLTEKSEPLTPPARSGFKVAVPPISDVSIQDRWEGFEGITDAQKFGLRYEQKVHQFLASIFEARYLPSPRVTFHDGWGYRSCVPDGVILFTDRRVVVEVKSQHMPEAWWQLRRLYGPVLDAYSPHLPTQLLEVCASYDPSMPFGEDVDVVYNVAEWCGGSIKPRFGVYPCKI